MDGTANTGSYTGGGGARAIGGCRLRGSGGGGNYNYPVRIHLFFRSAILLLREHTAPNVSAPLTTAAHSPAAANANAAAATANAATALPFI